MTIIRTLLAALLASGLLLATPACSDSSSGGDAAAAADPHAGHNHPPGAHGQPAPASGVIRGTIELAESVAVDPGAFDCIFLMGWRGEREGTPQLVRKLPGGVLPLRFELDARDLMGPGTLAGEWLLVARLDSDSDAEALRGDVEGVTLERAVRDGPTARIVLDRVLTAADERPLAMDAMSHGSDPSLGIEAPASDGLPAGHPPVAPNTLPAGHPSIAGGSAGGGGSSSGAASAGGPRIKGTVTLAEEYAGLNGTRTLFLMVRNKPTTSGMPWVVHKVSNPTFPFTFDLGMEHIPLQVENKEDLLQGQLYLTIRLDSDGSIMKGAGDIELAEPLPVKADGVEVSAVLDTRREQ